MMIEQNTNYAYKLKHMDNPTFDKVRDLSTKFYRELPPALQDELFEALNHGIDILDSEPQMTAYLYAFGKMHKAKLNYAFEHLPETFFEIPEINIIDYGCGQALGTMCYADYLRENGYSQKVKTITLIEPSEMCLKRAALHASVFFPDAEIRTINKTFDELYNEDIFCKEEMPTLHLLSNVLDVLDFDLDGFAELIEDSICGYNQFVCVGPYFNYPDKDERMEAFCSLLNCDEYYCEIFDKYEFDEEKAWTAQIICFSVGEPEKEQTPTPSSTVNEVLKGYNYSLKEHFSTYDDSDVFILYLFLSKKYKGQDYLVLSKSSAEAYLKCKDEKEQKEFLGKCHVVYSDEANCFGVVLPSPKTIGKFIFDDNWNNSVCDASSVMRALRGIIFILKESNNSYDDSKIPILFLSLSKEYKGQDYLVLSKASAETFLKCKDYKEQKEYLGKCRIVYSKEADCWGVIMPDDSKLLGEFTF